MSVICQVCNRPLKANASLTLGVGRVCAKKVMDVMVQQMQQEGFRMKDYDSNNQMIQRAIQVVSNQNQEKREQRKMQRNTVQQATKAKRVGKVKQTAKKATTKKGLIVEEAKPTPIPSYEYSAKLQQALKEAEHSIRFNKMESAFVFDKDGNQLWRKRGGKNHVNVAEASRKGLLVNAVLTHNHPSDDAFSYADVSVMIEERVFEFRAVGREKEHTIRLREDMYDKCESLSYRYELCRNVKQEYDTAYDEVIKERVQKIRSGEISRWVSYKGCIHEVWERVNQRMGNIFIYERKTNEITYDQERMEKLLKKDKNLRADYTRWQNANPDTHENVLKGMFQNYVIFRGEVEKKYQEIS